MSGEVTTLPEAHQSHFEIVKQASFSHGRRLEDKENISNRLAVRNEPTNNSRMLSDPHTNPERLDGHAELPKKGLEADVAGTCEREMKNGHEESLFEKTTIAIPMAKIGKSDIEFFSTRVCEGPTGSYVKHVHTINSDNLIIKNPLHKIPDCDQVWQKVKSLLPQWIFRVTNAGSAGNIFVDDAGLTHFQSHAVFVSESTSEFASFSREDVASQLKLHIHGWKKPNRIPFSSHWISTSDSMIATLSRAERRFRSGHKDVKIYVIDTHTLQKPSLALLMYLAIKAWNVEVEIVPWRWNLYRHGSLNEWIFWDEIVAAKVETINYESFAWPQRKPGQVKAPPTLRDVLPEVAEITRAHLPDDMLRRLNTEEDKDKLSKKWTSQPKILSKLYFTSRELSEMEEYRHMVRRYPQMAKSKTFIKFGGHIQKEPKSIREDQRSLIDDYKIEEVWRFVSGLENRNLFFVGILAARTRKYYVESIVDGILRRHPKAITDNLVPITILNQKDADSGSMTGISQKVLVHYTYKSGLNFFDRIGSDSFQNLLTACVEKWTASKTREPIEYRDSDIYIVPGQYDPMRALIRPIESGTSGRCRTIVYNSTNTDYETILKYGEEVRQSDIDREHAQYHMVEYGREFYNIGADKIETFRYTPKSAHQRLMRKRSLRTDTVDEIRKRQMLERSRLCDPEPSDDEAGTIGENLGTRNLQVAVKVRLVVKQPHRRAIRT